MPDATFTTDVIVGFPGETDEAFAHTCRLVEEIGFIKLHIFPFSPRPGTAAAAMADTVPDAVKEARARALATLERTLFQRQARQRVGADVSVLVEKTGRSGNGLTPHYFRVDAPFPPGWRGSVQTVRVTGYGEDHLIGTVET